MEVGRQLFEARQRQNLTLVDISRTTKIPVHLLEAIERDDVDHLPLPQGFFTRAFVRAYAKEVGVDADSLVDSIEESEVEQVPMDLPTVNVPIEEHTSSRSFVAAIGLCAACTAYSGFAWKTVAPATPQVAVANAAQPLHVAAVNAVASPPCVAVPPPASAVQATRRIPPSAVSQDVVTVGTAAPPAVNHVTAEPAPAPADQNPTSVPAQQF
jgi:cytoskeletal protein RodZ